jgi:hypothetical protein
MRSISARPSSPYNSTARGVGRIGVDHGHLLRRLGTFPAREQIKQWLKAGVVEREQLTPTEEGAPQGGVISPTLLNVALHGLDEAAGVRYLPDGMRHAGKLEPGTLVVIRHADDLVALCVSEEQARQVKQQLAVWLAPRGLALNEDKTRVVRLEECFDNAGGEPLEEVGDLAGVRPGAVLPGAPARGAACAGCASPCVRGTAAGRSSA